MGDSGTCGGSRVFSHSTERGCRRVSNLFLSLILLAAMAPGARAEEFAFATQAARLVLRSDGLAVTLTATQNSRPLLRPEATPFAAVKKGGRLFPVSAIERRGDLLHLTFGTSGVQADLSITAHSDYLLLELAEINGDGIEELRLVQLGVALANAGSQLAVRWDDDFAVCLMGLSPRVDAKVAGNLSTVSLYPEFGMKGERVAIITAPTPRFLNTVQTVERDFHIPSPTLGGQWAKMSADARQSYLFTDLTEANADETIRYAKLGGFRYILVYSNTWSTSLGSYPTNTMNFPGGEGSLKAVIDKCHAAGLKVGMHMLTSFVGKNDPLVRPIPDPRLLKDAEAMLSADASEKATELAAGPSLEGFPVEGAFYGGNKAGRDIVIDDEIIQYRGVGAGAFRECVRGFAGTRPAAHKAGAKIQHLAERYGSYLADLRTPLGDVIADRVAGLINRCGFDMIYFDGGEVNSANGPYWYWAGPQQLKIWERSKRDLLVHGSGSTHWTWHIFSRGTCDDFSAVAVKEYLDYHKIADSWRSYHNNFLPAELGWWGFLDATPDHPATVPDEVEYYAARMLALDSAVSLETNLNALKSNGRTEEMLKLLGQYEQFRLSGATPKEVREQLTRGEWHRTADGRFHPVRYDVRRVTASESIAVRNEFDEQPLKFRLEVLPALSPAGDAANIPLIRTSTPFEIKPPEAGAAMPGALAQRVEFTGAQPDQASVFMVGPAVASGAISGKPLNLVANRALAVRLEVEGQAPGETPVLNVQLEAGGKTYRDYYIDLGFNGSKTLILPEPGTNRTLAEFRPAGANYAFKAAMYHFNYAGVVALNLRWMCYPKARQVRCRISQVEAIAERDVHVTTTAITIGAMSIAIPREMKTGDYAEYWADGAIRIFDRNGVPLGSVPAPRAPQLAKGDNRIAVTAETPGANWKLTVITLGRSRDDER